MDPKSVLLGLREKSVGLSKAQTRIPWREIIRAYLSSEKPSTSSSSESSSSTSTESESATTSESTSTPAETTQPEPETPAETTPAPETPSTSTGGSTTTAPNPGAQQVYDQVQNGGSGSTEKTNESMFGNAKDGSHLLDNGTDIGLHAAP